MSSQLGHPVGLPTKSFTDVCFLFRGALSMVTEVVRNAPRQDNMCAMCSVARPVVYRVQQCNVASAINN